MSMTVTMTTGGGNFNGVAMYIRVMLFGTTAGTSTQNTLSSGTAQSSVTPTKNSSYILWVAADGTGVATFTAAANNTKDFDGGSTSMGQAFGHYSGSITAGTPITVGTSAPTTDNVAWAIYEIPQTGTNTPIVYSGSPAGQSNDAATTLTSAAFTPLKGSMVVVMCVGNGSGSGNVTCSLTNTGGLNFTAVQQTTSVSEYAGIFVAQIPDPSFQPPIIRPHIFSPGIGR